MSRWIVLLLAAVCPFVAESQQYIQSQPIYHANGIFASSGIAQNTFYHENGLVAWFGMNNSDPRVFHQNGAIAWKGYFDKECSFSYSNCTVFHKNGEKAWKGSTYHNATFSNDPCTVFHDNGSTAWKGALNKDCNFSYGACTVYFRNGQIAWKGATPKESFYTSDPCTVFHSNGKPAWKGSFPFETASIYTYGVFHDNGELAWSGKRGEPIYDRNGYVVTASAEAINMPIGENSWLYLSYNGHRQLHVSIGDQSFLTFSNQDPENPRLLIHLGTGYNLECYPYTGNMPHVTIYGTPIPVRDRL